MAHLKSQTQVDIYLGTLKHMLLDLADMYPDRLKSFLHDINTVEHRVGTEGLSFLTKTLPKLGKAFDLSLETGQLEVPREFKRSPKNRAIPAFLQGMFSCLFGTDGTLVHNANFRIVQHIRQICFACYKLELPYSATEVKVFLDNFVAVDESVGLPSRLATTEVAQRLVEFVCQGIDFLDILPKHGPGAVATGEKAEQKWHFSRYYPSLHSVYPWHEFFSCQGQQRPGNVTFFSSWENIPTAKVVLVPKDSRGPRVISCEPLEFQWIQQGIARNLIRRINSSSWTKDHVNFSDQSINGELARISSRHGYFSTIDLKEASDRVSCDLVKALFPKELHTYLFAARSTHTLLPDGRVVQMKKYAPMGSALCFPVEALIFWALCVAGVASSRCCGLRRAADDVYVYGDDIIIPVDCFDVVVKTLEDHGLMVNSSKCYKDGPFRESCGIDAFDGYNVTPTKLRTLWSNSSVDGNAFASYCSYANDFRRKGYRRCSDYLCSELTELYGLIPYGSPNCGYPCIEHPSRVWSALLNAERGFRMRWNALGQRTEVKVRVLIPRKRTTTLDDYPRLLRAITGNVGSDPETETAPRQYKLRSRWMKAT